MADINLIYGRFEGPDGPLGPPGPPGPTGAEGNEGVTTLNVKTDYGAVGDGLVDDTAAIQAALDDARLWNYGASEIIFFPAGTYRTTTTLHADWNAGQGCKLMGAGGSRAANRSKILYEGNETGVWGGALTLNDCFGWEVCNLQISYSNPNFRGDLVQVGNRPPVGSPAADPQGIHIHDCQFSWNSNARGPARSLLRTNNAIHFVCDNVKFFGAEYGVYVDATYANAYQIEKCVFNFSQKAHIGIAASDVEALTIRDCSFEAGTNTTGVYFVSGSQVYQCTIEGCWFGDASLTTLGPTYWIDGIYTLGVLSVLNNYFGSCFAGGCAIRIGRPSGGNLGARMYAAGNCFTLGNGAVVGFSFDSQADFSTVWLVSNYLLNAVPWRNNLRPLSYWASGNVGIEDSKADTNTQALQLGGSLGSTDAPIQLGTLAVGITSGQLVNLPAGVTWGTYIGTGTPPGQSGRTRLVIQGVNVGGVALASNRADDGTIKAGQVPRATFETGDQKIGFYGAQPVVQPAAYRLSNHVASRTLDETTATAAQVANMLGTLIKDLTTLGLLTENIYVRGTTATETDLASSEYGETALETDQAIYSYDYAAGGAVTPITPDVPINPH